MKTRKNIKEILAYTKSVVAQSGRFAEDGPVMNGFANISLVLHQIEEYALGQEQDALNEILARKMVFHDHTPDLSPNEGDVETELELEEHMFEDPEDNPLYE